MAFTRESFEPRAATPATEEVVRLHLARVEVLGDNLPGEQWRDWLCFDLGDCRHVSQKIVEIDNQFGIWEVAICVDCGEQVAKQCAHIRCDWFADGKVLRCGNCGTDAT